MGQVETIRRTKARARMGEIRALCRRLQVHDAKTAHVTVWLDTGQPVEWWPGRGKWASRGKGSFEAFRDWLAAQREAVTKTEGVTTP